MTMTMLMTVHLAKVVPGVRQAILWSVAALEQISNCWRHTQILPPTMSAEISSNMSRSETQTKLQQQLSQLISSLNLGF